jgi:hypothetical protein
VTLKSDASALLEWRYVVHGCQPQPAAPPKTRRSASFISAKTAGGDGIGTDDCRVIGKAGLALIVSLVLCNSAGVGFAQDTRESRMSLFLFRRGLGSLHLNPGVEIISTPGFFFAPTRDHSPETA